MRSDIAAALEALSVLAREVSDARDREEIRELTAAYNHCFDDVDIEGWLATFTTDARFAISGGATLQGHEQLRAFHEEMGFGRVHITADHTIEITGDEATQVCSLVLGERSAARTPDSAQIKNTGRYADRLRRVDGSWRFAERVFTADAEIVL